MQVAQRPAPRTIHGGRSAGGTSIIWPSSTDAAQYKYLGGCWNNRTAGGGLTLCWSEGSIRSNRAAHLQATHEGR